MGALSKHYPSFLVGAIGACLGGWLTGRWLQWFPPDTGARAGLRPISSPDADAGDGAAGAGAGAGAGLEPPVIDVGHLAAGPGRAAAVAALLAAARTSGVARLRNHGAARLEAARRAGHAYFALPDEVKGCSGCWLRNVTIGFQRGYIPMAAESGLATVRELKEGFCYGFDWPAGWASRHPFQAANIWPNQAALATLGDEWRQSMQGFFEDLANVSAALVSAFDGALGPRPAGSLHALSEGGETISQMRMFHYLPMPEVSAEQKCMGSSPHTDWHMLTLIARDDLSVLQYVDKKTGRWVNATGIASDELLLLIGDWLSIYSEGELHSAAHRVLLPAAGQGSSLSFVFFSYPAPEARLPAPKEEEGSGRGWRSRHREELNTIDESMLLQPWGDYVVGKWAKVMSNR